MFPRKLDRFDSWMVGQERVTLQIILGGFTLVATFYSGADKPYFYDRHHRSLWTCGYFPSPIISIKRDTNRIETKF